MSSYEKSAWEQRGEKPPLYRWTPEMRKEVDRLRKAGTRYAELGKMYGVTAGRIRQMNMQTQRMLRYGCMQEQEQE